MLVTDLGCLSTAFGMITVVGTTDVFGPAGYDAVVARNLGKVHHRRGDLVDRSGQIMEDHAEFSEPVLFETFQKMNAVFGQSTFLANLPYHHCSFYPSLSLVSVFHFFTTILPLWVGLQIVRFFCCGSGACVRVCVNKGCSIPVLSASGGFGHVWVEPFVTLVGGRGDDVLY